jgi:hypothetical protein
MAAVSAAQIDPETVIKPESPQARRSHPGAPTNRAESAETIKIPDPIIEPITIMVASIVPSSRTSDDLDDKAADAAEVWDDMRS